MAERVASNTLIIIFTTIIVIFSVIVLVQQVEANLMFWILRPSDTTALDMVSKVNALTGTKGRVTTDYRNITKEVDYYITNDDKIVCVIAQKKELGSLPLKTINCYSTSKSVIIPDKNNIQSFLLCLQKYYDIPTGQLIVDTWWCSVDRRCGDFINVCLL